MPKVLLKYQNFEMYFYLLFTFVLESQTNIYKKDENSKESLVSIDKYY